MFFEDSLSARLCDLRFVASLRFPSTKLDCSFVGNSVERKIKRKHRRREKQMPECFATAVRLMVMMIPFIFWISFCDSGMNLIGSRSSPRMSPIPDFRVLRKRKRERERKLSDTAQTSFPCFYRVLFFRWTKSEFIPAVRFEETEKTLSFEALVFWVFERELGRRARDTFQFITGNVYERYSILVTLVTENRILLMIIEPIVFMRRIISHNGDTIWFFIFLSIISRWYIYVTIHRIVMNFFSSFCIVICLWIDLVDSSCRIFH